MYLEKYSDYWLNEIFELRRQQLFRSLNEIHPTSIKGRKLGSGNFKSKPVQLACRGKDIVKVVIIQKKIWETRNSDFEKYSSTFCFYIDIRVTEING